jgi:hypothetical protein
MIHNVLPFFLFFKYQYDIFHFYFYNNNALLKNMTNCQTFILIYNIIIKIFLMDDEFKKIIFTLNVNQRRDFYIKNHYIDIYNKIIEFNNNYIKSNNFSQMLYNYVYDIKEIKLCPICQKNELKFKNFNIGYRKYCSPKCVMSNKELIFKRNEKSIITNLKKYGVTNPLKNEEIKQKVRKTIKEKYNTDYYIQTEEFKNKMKDYNMKMYGKEYYFQTEEFKNKSKLKNIEKYNVDHYMKNKEIKEKIKNIHILKYGVPYIPRTEESKQKYKNTHIQIYGYEHYMIYKKENNMFKDFFNNQSTEYYHNFDNIHYKLINVDNKYLNMLHINKHDFSISKQLFYLRKKKHSEICTICNPTDLNVVSEMEKELYEFININYNGEILTNTKKIIYPYELDIYIPNLKLAFEFNGLYWHSEINKPNDYHKNKTELCDKKDIKLIHVYEDDWTFKRNIIKSLILKQLNYNFNEILVNECILSEINDISIIKEFINNNSIDYYKKSNINIGLFYDNKLISLMTIIKNKNNYTICNYCEDINIIINGAINTYINYIIEKYKPIKIQFFIENNNISEKILKDIGFIFKKRLQPSCYDIIEEKRIISINNNSLYNKIYDSGKKLYVLSTL